MRHLLSAILGWVGLLGAFMSAATPVVAQAPPPSSVVVSVSPSNGPSVMVGETTSGVTLTASAGNVPNDPYATQSPLDSWVWGYTVEYAAGAGAWGNAAEGAGYTVNISPPPLANPTTSILTASFGQAGYWKVTPTATVTYRDLSGNVRTETGTPAMPLYVTVVGLATFQFQLPGGGFHDIPAEGLYVAAGTSVAFQAVPFPAGAAWPSGQPAWGGMATGSGPQTTVTFSTISTSMSDAAEVQATCGNTVSISVVRYGPDEVTLEYGWDDESPGNLVARATYRLWVPDADGDGRPDAPGGYAVLKLLDFEDPENTPIVERTRWPFNNAEFASRKYVILTAEIPELSGDTSPELTASSRRRSNYRRLEGAHDDGRVFGQVAADPVTMTKNAIEIYKELGGPQVVQFLLKQIEAIYAKKNISITPASPASDSVDINMGGGMTQTIHLTQTVLATADPTWLAKVGEAIVIKDPTVEATVTGDTSTFKKDNKIYCRALNIIVWNGLKELMGANGWYDPTEDVIKGQADFNGSAPGRSFKVNGLDPGKVYGAINYATVGAGATTFGNYKWAVGLHMSGQIIKVRHEGGTDGTDLLNKLQTINWPRVIN